MIASDTLRAMIISSINLFHERDLLSVSGESIDGVKSIVEKIDELDSEKISLEKMKELDIFKSVMGIYSCYIAFIPEGGRAKSIGVSVSEWNVLVKNLRW